MPEKVAPFFLIIAKHDRNFLSSAQVSFQPRR